MTKQASDSISFYCKQSYPHFLPLNILPLNKVSTYNTSCYSKQSYPHFLLLNILPLNIVSIIHFQQSILCSFTLSEKGLTISEAFKTY